MSITIDPVTGDFVGIDRDKQYTWQEIRGITAPCPVCAGRVFVTPVPVNAEEGTKPSSLYQIGKHECVNGCDLGAGSAG